MELEVSDNGTSSLYVIHSYLDNISAGASLYLAQRAVIVSWF